jgi:NTE family protein
LHWIGPRLNGIDGLEHINGFWDGLDTQAREALRAAMRPRRLERGEILIEEGAPADTLYVVDFGLFQVRSASGLTLAEIGAGELIGEIGFFAREPRTAEAVAARDSQVYEIDREHFEALTLRTPSIQGEVIRALAVRLYELAKVARDRPRGLRGRRMIVVAGAGSRPPSAEFLDGLASVLAGQPGRVFLTSSDAAPFVAPDADPYAFAGWLAEAERAQELVVCAADATLTAWSQATLRGADEVVMVAEGEAEPPGPVARLACELFQPARRRLVLRRPRRNGFCEPSAAWREGRDVFMVHNVSLEDLGDLSALARFLSGSAIGFVASGGGAFGPAHVGIVKAFQERGVIFDIFGGASVGAAMAAAFAALIDSETIRAGTHEIFVRRKALKRLTWPRYGLLDHSVFDEELARHYPGLIEDIWKPFFAVATDLSNYALRILRRGPAWQAIRASAAIPGVLPPFIDAEGHMLVDGGVVDNVPLAAMRSLKAGPNLVVDLRPQGSDLFAIDYGQIPGRRALMARMLAPLPGRAPLPRFPSPTSVIQRTMFANIGVATPRGDTDLVLQPPVFPGSSFMDWRGHGAVLDAAYAWAHREIDRGIAEGEPALAALLAAGRA